IQLVAGGRRLGSPLISAKCTEYITPKSQRNPEMTGKSTRTGISCLVRVGELPGNNQTAPGAARGRFRRGAGNREFAPARHLSGTPSEPKRISWHGPE